VSLLRCSAPHIKFFETACITDNATGAVLLPEEVRA
jgi:hypothetical protein